MKDKCRGAHEFIFHLAFIAFIFIFSTPKNLKPNKEKRKRMGEYEGISSMNHFGFMKINDCVDFSYPNCFVALYKVNHRKHYIFQPFMSMLR